MTDETKFIHAVSRKIPAFQGFAAALLPHQKEWFNGQINDLLRKLTKLEGYDDSDRLTNEKR